MILAHSSSTFLLKIPSPGGCVPYRILTGGRKPGCAKASPTGQDGNGLPSFLSFFPGGACRGVEKGIVHVGDIDSSDDEGAFPVVGLVGGDGMGWGCAGIARRRWWGWRWYPREVGRREAAECDSGTPWGLHRTDGRADYCPERGIGETGGGVGRREYRSERRGFEWLAD